MTLPIRSITFALLICLAPPALAQDWPTKPVRILVSFPAGGASDLVARLLAQHLTESLGQQVVVENKPGAAGTIAAGELKSSPADGYTLMLSNLTPFSIAPTLMPEAGYDPVTDFTHVSYLGASHLALFVQPELEAPDLAAFVAKAKAAPGSLDYGSSGVGSWGHLVAETFKAEAGAEMEHIPYQGSGPMVLDFRADIIAAMFDAVTQNLPLIAEGTAVPLAVTSPERLAVLPEVPTFRELGYDIVAENWLGLSAPAGLDPAIAAKIDAAVAQVLAQPAVTGQFATWGIELAPLDADFAAFITSQYEAWKVPAQKVAVK
ncbi:Bug family tripartite tricarboxylate transporter substrate binding protein [Frigidibacter mobilis]|uniref:Twin-arginine translocation pathway signal n=1 Tax=Frigidibacter mobilis TaxID=1335048 RepID=A0A165SHZ7_9RHOB|nr:tripartite tricarboxylate transporter substrate binding protein [Frigidibacter mobilis]AMY68269.1 twin-arginine translocation pathway signal [Frigidibacter mobilis]